MGVYLINVHLTGVHLMGVYPMGVYFIGVNLMDVHLIYESSLRAGHGWRESLYRHPGWFKSFWLWATRPSGCWSPLERTPRGEKLPKRLPNGFGAAEAKAAALHPKWYQSSLSKLSTRGGRGGEKKRRQSDWLSGDRQTG
jgi:hypothetical protein